MFPFRKRYDFVRFSHDPHDSPGPDDDDHGFTRNGLFQCFVSGRGGLQWHSPFSDHPARDMPLKFWGTMNYEGALD